MTIKVLREGGLWKVVGQGVNIEARELEWAIFDALTLAEIQGVTVELGEGVPKDALERGRRPRDHLEGFRRSGT
jgi:hypothetical protein